MYQHPVKPCRECLGNHRTTTAVDASNITPALLELTQHPWFEQSHAHTGGISVLFTGITASSAQEP